MNHYYFYIFIFLFILEEQMSYRLLEWQKELHQGQMYWDSSSRSPQNKKQTTLQVKDQSIELVGGTLDKHISEEYTKQVVSGDFVMWAETTKMSPNFPSDSL